MLSVNQPQIIIVLMQVGCHLYTEDTSGVTGVSILWNISQ